MDELQQQIVNRESVYEKILHCKELEQEIGERIQKQFYQKQIELEYVSPCCPCFRFLSKRAIAWMSPLNLELFFFCLLF